MFTFGLRRCHGSLLILYSQLPTSPFANWSTSCGFLLLCRLILAQYLQLILASKISFLVLLILIWHSLIWIPLVPYRKNRKSRVSFGLSLAIIQIPKKLNWEEFVSPSSHHWKWQVSVSELFEERPIWTRDSVVQRLLDKGLKCTHHMLNRWDSFLIHVSYIEVFLVLHWSTWCCSLQVSAQVWVLFLQRSFS